MWKVSDGDTLCVSDETGKKTKVRMNRIDAPEMNQPYGKESADRLAELVLGKYVTLQADGTDRYGRSLEVVFVETNATTHAKMDVNLQLVKEGLAWQNTTPTRHLYTRLRSQKQRGKRSDFGARIIPSIPTSGERRIFLLHQIRNTTLARLRYQSSL